MRVNRAWNGGHTLLLYYDDDDQAKQSLSQLGSAVDEPAGGYGARKATGLGMNEALQKISLDKVAGLSCLARAGSDCRTPP